MKKHKLLRMAALQATPEMIDLAEKDIPHTKKDFYRSIDVYKRGLYLRCIIQNHIFEVTPKSQTNILLSS